MADRTEIAWCDSTFNPWIGCTKVGPGCDHCYAERDMDQRRHRVRWGAGQERSRTSAAYWKQPLRWNRADFVECAECGWRGEVTSLVGACQECLAPYGWAETARRRVFCASLADVFDNEVDPQWRRDLFDVIRATPRLDWLLLTKRIGNAKAMIAQAGGDIRGGIGGPSPEPLPNVWLGATVVNQEEVARDVPKLLHTPAAVRFISAEPLLGPIELALPDTGWRRGLDWVVCGGESGPGARPMHPAWARSLRDQCTEAGVPFLFKQWGAWAPFAGPYVAGDMVVDSDHLRRVGKKAAGRLLDGVLHDEFPRAA